MGRIYQNIGGKLKGLAKFVAFVGVAIGILVTLTGAIGSSSFLAGILIAISSLIGSWPMYGFGELIEKVSFIASCIKNEPDDHQ